MKMESILRAFLTAIFVFGIFAVTAQAKFYVYKSNGSTVEYSIDQVDSISLTEPAPKEWVDITSDVLSNTSAPFAHGASPVITLSDGTLYAVTDWTANSEASKNGNVFYRPSDNFFDGHLGFVYWVEGYVGNIVNGKIYQTVNLDAGAYRFTAELRNCEGWGSQPIDVYVVAAWENDLPDIDQVEQYAISSTKIPWDPSNPWGLPTNTPYTIEFNLDTPSQVSLGFVGTVGGGQATFTSVKLEKEE